MTGRQMVPAGEDLPPAFGGPRELATRRLRAQVIQATHDWLGKTPSANTQEGYARDLKQFMEFAGIDPQRPEGLTRVLPGQVAAWRDALATAGATASTIRRKLTAIRSLFSYLQVYGYSGANPAHGKFVKAPSVPRDGKTVGLSPADCRRLLDAPDTETPIGIRDRALLGVLAYTACRVSEVIGTKVRDYKTTGEHRVLAIIGKGGKERVVPLHPEAVERISVWIEAAGIGRDRRGPLFRPPKTGRGQGRDGFKRAKVTRQAIDQLVRRYVKRLELDPAITVHSLRVTALTTARERGADIIDLQDFAGHADPRTTLTYIRSRDRLSKSPAYVLKY